MTAIPPDPSRHIGLSPGSRTGLVRPGAALLLDADVEDPIVRALSGTTTVDDLDATLRMLWHRSKRGLPGFAYAIERPEDHVIIVSGTGRAVAVAVDGGTTTVTAADTRTWAEHRVADRATLVLTMDDQPLATGEHFVEDGIVPASALTIFRWGP